MCYYDNAISCITQQERRRTYGKHEQDQGEMKELELTQADVAHCLNIAQPTANQKINNVRPFDLDEAEKLSHLLHIDAGEFGKYFFTQ